MTHTHTTVSRPYTLGVMFAALAFVFALEVNMVRDVSRQVYALEASYSSGAVNTSVLHKAAERRNERITTRTARQRRLVKPLSSSPRRVQ